MTISQRKKLVFFRKKLRKTLTFFVQIKRGKLTQFLNIKTGRYQQCFHRFFTKKTGRYLPLQTKRNKCHSIVAYKQKEYPHFCEYSFAPYLIKVRSHYFFLIYCRVFNKIRSAFLSASSLWYFTLLNCIPISSAMS